MLPKKIYLNYVDENDEDKTWSEEPISVYDCKMQNREYTDLSQVWHDATEEPELTKWAILCHDTKDCYWAENRIDTQLFHRNWEEYAKYAMIDKWAYISDLLPKGGEK